MRHPSDLTDEEWALVEPLIPPAKRGGKRSVDLRAVVNDQDRDGGVWVIATLFVLYPFLLKLHADGGYQRPAFQAGLRRVCRRVEVERRINLPKDVNQLPILLTWHRQRELLSFDE